MVKTKYFLFFLTAGLILAPSIGGAGSADTNKENQRQVYDKMQVDTSVQQAQPVIQARPSDSVIGSYGLPPQSTDEFLIQESRPSDSVIGALGMQPTSTDELRKVHPCTSCYTKLAQSGNLDFLLGEALEHPNCIDCYLELGEPLAQGENLGDLSLALAKINQVHVNWVEEEPCSGSGGVCLLVAQIKDNDNDGTPDTVNKGGVKLYVTREDISAVDLYRFIKGKETLLEYVRGLYNTNINSIYHGSWPLKFGYVTDEATWEVTLLLDKDSTTVLQITISKVEVDGFVTIEADSPYFPNINYRTLVPSITP